ncbi:hypothetical protein TREMEDRAFT_71997 [Tremella mesenterica DSM 1558]|uniref:uncharacterized protein n=1 Tax=Tremella mesenterica (strain ATCC 24925 / CBS 8224 / DSM 1558 / NBRC 9311 / NRRL Y-6157 / RJB 2259-6 / UBC 559-6) TaxID=578456 RepID=UPI0003F49A8D|nr:uncharacterized protein TREMEDRAFT_71997 [Tremella mesenterica DSM 1558]EIW68435.1 hypothetical protein TREMEDRAFT_71997 [Tremella mesenterica DSM 1558]
MEPLLPIKSTVPSLSEDFYTHCKSLLIPPSGTYSHRLDYLSEVLGKSVWIAEPGPSVEYFLGGFGKSDWWLSERPLLVVVIPQTNKQTAVEGGPKVIILTPQFEALRASEISLPEEIQDSVKYVAWEESEDPHEILWKELGPLEVDGVVLDRDVREFVSSAVRERAGSGGVKSSIEVERIREKKDEREVGLLRCANQMTLHAIRQTRAKMYIGITESATRTILQKYMTASGLQEADGLVLFGENAALPHGSGTDRRLGKRDMILIDCGGTWGGYTSDITRTFALPSSKIPSEHIRLWELVRQAQQAPYELLKSSSTTSPPLFSAMDHSARSLISSHMSRRIVSTNSTPTPDFTVFTHRLGHGIGLEGHELPYLVFGNEGGTGPGHVFSLEPGIYLPQDAEPVHGMKGVGVRLEDCLAVLEKDGQLVGEWLSGPVERWGDV